VLVRGPGDSTLHAVTLGKLAVVVVDEAPLKVSVVPPAAPLAADGTLDVTVRVARGKDFAEPVEVTFPCLPPGVEVPTTVVIPADKTEAAVTLVASKDADLGAWSLVAEVAVARPGRADRDPSAVGMNGLGTPTPAPKGGRRRKSVEGAAAGRVGAAVRDAGRAPNQGAFAPAAAEQGKTVKVVCKLDGMLPGTFTASSTASPRGRWRARSKSRPGEGGRVRGGSGRDHAGGRARGPWCASWPARWAGSGWCTGRPRRGAEGGRARRGQDRRRRQTAQPARRAAVGAEEAVARAQGFALSPCGRGWPRFAAG
jgi:hypothetical protein